MKNEINILDGLKKDELNAIQEPSYKNNESNSNELNFNYNNSNYGSSNGSSAILFTSQFRDYINRDKNDDK